MPESRDVMPAILFGASLVAICMFAVLKEGILGAIFSLGDLTTWIAAQVLLCLACLLVVGKLAKIDFGSRLGAVLKLGAVLTFTSAVGLFFTGWQTLLPHVLFVVLLIWLFDLTRLELFATWLTMAAVTITYQLLTQSQFSEMFGQGQFV